MEHATSTLGRRDRKKHATRQAIVHAALDLFEEKGYVATTVDEIAERADVAQRTFFRHFPTKESVLFPDSDEGAHAFRSALADRPADEPVLTSVLLAFGAAVGDHDADDHALSLRRQAILEQEGVAGDSITWSSIVAGHRIIEEAVADHLDRPVTDEQVQLVSSVGLLLMTQAVPEWYAAGTGSAFAPILDGKLQALRALLDG